MLPLLGASTVFKWLLGAAGSFAAWELFEAVTDHYTTSPEEKQMKGKLDLMKEMRALEQWRSAEVARGIAADEADAKFFNNLRERVSKGAALAMMGPRGNVNLKTGVDDHMPLGQQVRVPKNSLLELLGPSYEEAQTNKAAAMALVGQQEEPV